MIQNNQIGPTAGLNVRRIDNTGAAITQQAHGRYAETVRRGNCYGACTATAGFTVVATESVSPLPANPDNPALAIWNPPDSGVDIAIMGVSLLFVSGTPAAGPWVWNYAIGEPCTVVAETNVATSGRGAFPMKIGGSAGSKARVFSNVALTGGVNAWTTHSPIAGSFAGAIAATSNQQFYVEVDGGIVCGPDTMICPAAPGTGTSQVVHIGIWWEEIPL